MKNKYDNQFSKSHKDYLYKLRKTKILTLLTQISILAILLLLWELLTRYNILDGFILSSPSRMVITLVNLFNSGNLWYHISVTLYEAFLGFIIATVVGGLIAVLLWWSEFIRNVLEPYLVVLNSLPKIALGPVIIIWFGAGTKSIIVMAFLILIIITILSLLNAFLTCENDKILLLKSMGATKFQILTKLVLPNSFKQFISVLKINVGMTWVGTIMGEYLVSRAGLGFLIVYGGQVFKLDLVMTSTAILCILAGVMYGGIAFLEKKLIK